MVKVRKNLIGQKFTKLTVLKQIDDRIQSNGRHIAMYECQCTCGNKIHVTYNNLTSGSTKSCGCYRPHKHDPVYKLRKNNKYDLTGESGIGYTPKGDIFYFDLEDYDKIKDYCWNYDNRGYLRAKDRTTHKTVAFHRLVVGNIPKGYVVDHKIHPHGKSHKSDNRKANLEIKTISQNNMNVQYYTNTKSGVLGVTYDKTQKKWQARIGINNKRIHLGWFKNKEDAIKARKNAEVKYFGNYSFDSINGG